jgi:hypothetical protein
MIARILARLGWVRKPRGNHLGMAGTVNLNPRLISVHMARERPWR